MGSPSKRSRWRWALGLAGLAVLILAAVPGVRTSLQGYYAYFAESGPYLGSRIAKVPVVVQDETLFQTLAGDARYQDYRRRNPDFSQPLEAQITAPHSAAEVTAYERFLAAHKADIKALAQPGKPLPDVLARKIIRRVHEAYAANQENPRQIDDGYLGTRNSRPEDFVFFLVNALTFCGTVGEATVALLRDAGFRARLAILSDSDRKLEVNHVFAEYYSDEKQHWVMVDPMVDFIPEIGGKYLSAFEFLRTPEAVAAANKAWNEQNYTSQSVMWFDRWGPIRYQYYYAADEAARGRLKEVL
jgi:hypothetical protein